MMAQTLIIPQEFCFPSFDGLPIYGHLSLQLGTASFPAVLVLCGGPGGAKDSGGQYCHLAEHQQLVPQGYAVFTVDHRGSHGHAEVFFAQQDLGGTDLQDVLASTQYLCQRSEIDSARIAIIGGSLGAYLAALAIAHHQVYRAAILLMGFYNLAAFMQYQLVLIPGLDHRYVDSTPAWDRVWTQITAYLQRHLSLG